jgi:serine/threonine protein phosphatase PrpC
MEVRAYGDSNVGKVRQANEDSFLVDQERNLFIVADGMGGHQGGGYASQNVIAIIKDEVARLEQTQDTTKPISDPFGRTASQIRLLHALQTANDRLYKKAMEESSLRGMGTTVTAVQLDHLFANIAHVGDSRLYILRASKLTQLSRDHSWVQEQVEAGVLTEIEARYHPLKNIITRSMGHDREVEVDLFKGEYKPGDKFLVCSDGLSNMVDDQTIREKMSSLDPEPAAKELIQLALDAGGLDNITVIIVEIKA